MFKYQVKFKISLQDEGEYSIKSVADPGFSWGGGVNSTSGIILQTFCRKLYENENKWTPEEGACPWRPLGSANGIWSLYNSAKNIPIEWVVAIT